MSVVADVTQPLAEVVAPLAPAPPPLPLFRLSVDQYHEMVRHGILMEDDKVELLDGLLVAKMTKSTAHCVANSLAHNSLAKIIPEGWCVDAQNAITLAASHRPTRAPGGRSRSATWTVSRGQVNHRTVAIGCG